MKNEQLLLCKKAAKQIYDTFDASHDWQHIERVLHNAKIIMEKVEADAFLVEAAILLHDVSDPKYKKPNHDPETEILNSIGISEKEKDRIKEIIASVSYKGGNGRPVTSIEAEIVQDADRLDAIGAVGIARTFAYGGAKGHKLYDWQEKPREEMTEEQYRTQQKSSTTHFYEKLLKLKDTMNTEAAKQIAEERHEFMLSFLKQLKTETDGNK